MRIVKPLDWEKITTTRKVVIVKGAISGNLYCGLWPKEEFFKSPLKTQTALSFADIMPLTGSVGYATFTDLEAWGPCILAVINEQFEALCVSGLVISFSQTTQWLSPARVHSDEAAQKAFKYPVRLASSPVSHYRVECDAPIPIVSDVKTLLDSRCREDVNATHLLRGRSVNAAQAIFDHSLGGVQDSPAYPVAASYESSAEYLALFSSAYVEFPHGLITYQNRIWSDSAVAAFNNDPTFIKTPNWADTGEEMIFSPTHVRNLNDIISGNGMKVSDGIPMIGNSSYNINHAHWIVNSLFAIYMLRDQILSGDILLLLSTTTPHMRESLRAIGIGADSHLEVKSGTYYFDRVLFPSTLSTKTNYFPPAEIANMFGSIRNSVGSDISGRTPELIYVTRIGSETLRKIENELELIEALAIRGFVSIAPHELSFTEEVECFSNAKVVVGQLGAGLINSCFSPAGWLVIEICSDNYMSNDYHYLSQVMGHRFARIVSTVNAEEHDHRTDFSFHVSVQRLLELVDAMLETLAS